MSSKIEDILDRAEDRENTYDWMSAAQLYLKVLDFLPEQTSRRGEVHERIGFALGKAAMQAENVDEFKDRLSKAIVNYEKALEVYSKLIDSTDAPRIFRCRAMLAYFGYWLASEASERRRLANECWLRTRDALKSFEEANNALEYGTTYNQLSSAAFLAYVLEWDFQAGKRIIKQAMEAGEQAVKMLSNVDNPCELARAYVKWAFYHSAFGYYFVPEMELKENYRKEGQALWLKANELSKEAALLELSRTSSAKCDEWGWSMDEMITNYSDARVYAEKAKDKLMIGTTIDWLTYATGWKAIRTDDPDKKLEIFQQALQYAEDTEKQFSSISFASARADLLWSGAPNTEYNFFVAALETDMKKRHDLLESAVAFGPDAIKGAENAGYPIVLAYIHHAMSKAQAALAKIENNRKRKHWLLKEALEHRKKNTEVTDQVYPFCYWDNGVCWNYLADLKLELSNFEKSSKNREKMLKEAVSDKSRALELAIREVLYWENLGDLSLFAALGDYQYSYGQLLTNLYELTSDRKHLMEAVKAFSDAAASYQKLSLFSNVGECYWKGARGLDALENHLEAAEYFRIASRNYKNSAEKLPQLSDFYKDHAVYMEAWSEIEKAKFYHARQEYDSAKEYFEKAASLHRLSKEWGYLASNYDAWAQVESGEDLSRSEQNEAARKAFEKAAQLFGETKELLQKELRRIENPDEKKMIVDIIKATEPRLGYSNARIAIEEAKILDKKGEHYFSSEKYGSARASLKKVEKTLESKKDKEEFELIAKLSEAWQKMTRAEAEASPTMYLQASQLFENAKELSQNEKTKMLALAHSRFCRALAAGTKFADSRDSRLYSNAVEHLESAANYYLKAGFQNASDYARATELLFEAYVHMDSAKKESEPEKKAKFYAMAEKVLQNSAESFTRAQHQEKKDQVLELLKNVKEERELALSLSEILHAPSAASTTATFATPTPIHEKAVGLERFEHADIQASIAVPQEIAVGEEFDVRLDIVNAAKSFGLLVRVDGLFPEGFTVVAFPSQYALQNGIVEIKGRRLDPLRVESIKLTLQATTAGSFNINPRLTYVDDTGKFKTCRLDPTSIIVHPQLKFEFKTEAARKTFDFLVASFTEDYMRRRLPLDKSGWRTLMDIVKQGNMSQYSAYSRKGGRGKAISELENRGLVEERVFPGERGRGGKILKLRIYYEKETVKRQIDGQVMKIRQK